MYGTVSFICSVSSSPLCRSHEVSLLSILICAESLCPQQCLMQRARSVSICAVAELTAEPVIVARRKLYVGRLRCWLYALLTGLRVLRGMSSNVGFHPPQLITRVKSVLPLAADAGHRGLSVRAARRPLAAPESPLGRPLTLRDVQSLFPFRAPPGAAPDFQ